MYHIPGEEISASIVSILKEKHPRMGGKGVWIEAENVIFSPTMIKPSKIYGTDKIVSWDIPLRICLWELSSRTALDLLQKYTLSWKNDCLLHNIIVGISSLEMP